MRRATLVGLVCSISAGCSSPNDPFTTGEGAALVQGVVTASSGATLPGTAVRIACSGTPSVVTATDASGGYLVNLSAPAATLDVRGTILTCRFSEPDLSTPRAQKDTVLAFSRGPVFLAKQMVDLQEH